MRVLHFKPTMRLEDGGVVKAVLDLCTMSQRDDDIGLATFDASGVPQDWLDPETTTTRVHHLEGDSSSSESLNSDQKNQLRDIIKKYDVVHLHSMWTVANPQVAAICKQEGIPYILSVHGMLDDWCMSQRKLKKVMYLKTWGRKLLRDASIVHCTAQAELDQASAWFKRSKGRVVPLPFDLEEYVNMPDATIAYDAFEKLDKELPKVLFLSRINYKKGVDRLIKASAILNTRKVKHQLVIAGTGDDSYVSQMVELAKSEGIEELTYFLGFASGAAKIALLGVCDVFALPTSQENFGFVFFESLASGTTVLTTKGTDTWPEIEASGGGVIVDNTPEAFADALEKIIEDREGYNVRAASAREWAHREMAVDKVREEYKTMYKSM
ncbi:MAG: glycosyltransferase [Phycisphaerales bacterium]|nr:glycosyltransferase [Phycisphaerales bacterium]